MKKANIEKIKKQLGELSDRVSQGDRIEAALELSCHTETVARYLRGEVKKESFGLELLGFLKNKIQEREKALL